MSPPSLVPRGASDRSFNEIALKEGDIFSCPACLEQLAVAQRTICWAETNWLKGVDNQAIICKDNRCFCDICGCDISDDVIYPVNWTKQ